MIHATTNYKALKPYLQQNSTLIVDGRRATITNSHYPDYFGDPVYRLTLWQGQKRDPAIVFSVNHQTRTIRPLKIFDDDGFQMVCYHSSWRRVEANVLKVDEYIHNIFKVL